MIPNKRCVAYFCSINRHHWCAEWQAELGMYLCECECHEKGTVMTTLSVYCGYAKIEVDDIVEDVDEPQYMGGFRVVYPGAFDITLPCDMALFSTAEEAIEFAQKMANGYLELLEALEIIPTQFDVTWEDISPPN